MAREWIDVVDTAIKIGLGSFITGVFTYIGLKLNKKSELNKHFIEHKTKLIEDAMNYSQEYFAASRRYVSSIKGVSRDLNNTDLIEIPDYVRTHLLNADKTLQEGWTSREKAISNLALLGAERCVELLKKTFIIEGELRGIVVFESKIPTYSYAMSVSKKINKEISLIQKEISAFYDAFHEK